MARTAPLLHLKTQKILQQLGENIRLARLRRDLPLELIAERAHVSRNTVTSVEAGTPGTSMAAYASVLHAIGGMDNDLLKIAADDGVGRELQDLNLPKRAGRRRS